MTTLDFIISFLVIMVFAFIIIANIRRVGIKEQWLELIHLTREAPHIK